VPNVNIFYQNKTY